MIMSSLSSRRAWIEIAWILPSKTRKIVALLTESVDWNTILSRVKSQYSCRSPHGERGLKYRLHRNLHQSNQSLSSRRAWIEITEKKPLQIISQSLSSRRAWIEIIVSEKNIESGHVALLTESVDWNTPSLNRKTAVCCRSPHGERGLKWLDVLLSLY